MSSHNEWAPGSGAAAQNTRLALARPGSSWRLPVLVAGLLVLLVVGLAVALVAPPPLRVDVGAAGDGVVVRNFYAPEQQGEQGTAPTTFRWSGPGARLVLAGAGGGPSGLHLRLNGAALTARTQPGGPNLWLERGAERLAGFRVEPGWRVYRILLPAGALVGDGLQAAPLGLISPVARPGPADALADDRYLGLPLDWLELVPLAGGAAGMVTAGERALLLAWGVALLAGALWLLARLLAVGRWWVAPAAGVLALALLAWAWREPYSLARLVPLTPGGLGLATLVLLASAGLVVKPWRDGLATLVLLASAGLVVNPWRDGLATLGHEVGRWVSPWAGGALLVGAAHLALWLPLPVEWRSGAALLLLWLPGALLAWLLFRHERDRLLLLFLGLCGALALAALLLLGLQALPGPLPWWGVLLPCDALSVGLAWLLWRGRQRDAALSPSPGPDEEPAGGAPHSPFRIPHSPYLRAALVVVLVGMALRLLLLGGSEFQGDESRAILMAAGVVHGQDDVLLLRPKGPVEVLLPAGLLALTGQINEGAARLPYALAGVGVLVGVLVLARELLRGEAGRTGWSVGLLAAAVLALDGMLLAFARIVQYQSIILVMMAGALWCGWRFALGAPHPRRYLGCAAVLAAVGLLAHYDGLFVLPALGWLVVWGGWRRGWRGWRWPGELVLPGLLGVALLASFYLPFVLHEHFGAATADYLTYRLREGDTSSLAFNNLAGYYGLATFYSPLFQMVALPLVLVVALLVWLVRAGRPLWLGRLLALLLVAGCAIQVGNPALFGLPGGQNWAILAFGLPLAGLILSPATPAVLRLLLLWFGAPFVGMAFLIAEPRTHFYAMHPAAALLVALALVELLAWLRRRSAGWQWVWLVRVLSGVGAGLVLLALPYLWLAFLRQQPEFLRDFPASRPALYRASYGDSLPTDAGYFAFPQRDGWAVVAELYRRGVLRGSYGSNKKPLITGWYLRGVYRCDADPASFLLARAESAILPEGYHLAGYVLVDGLRMLDIYSRAPAPPIPRGFELADYRAAFAARSVESFPTQGFLFDVVPQYRLDAAWQGGLRLRGYDLFEEAQRRGGAERGGEERGGEERGGEERGGEERGGEERGGEERGGQEAKGGGGAERGGEERGGAERGGEERGGEERGGEERGGEERGGEEGGGAEVRGGGWRLEQWRTAGERVTLVLYWQVAQAPGVEQAGYTVVVDLLDGAGQTVAQAQPTCGGSALAGSLADASGADRAAGTVSATALTLQPAVPLAPGRYTLRVGLRNRATGAWLPLAGAAADAQGRVRFGTLLLADE